MIKNLIKLTPYSVRNHISRYIRFCKDKRWETLDQLIKEHNVHSYCEVGVFKGDTLLYLAEHNPKLIMVGVDPFSPKSYLTSGLYKQDLSKLSPEEWNSIYYDLISKTSNNVFIDRQPSIIAAKQYANESFDLIFIDANHDYKSVKQDIKAWLPKVRQGGLLCGHDYTLEFFGVIQAVNELLGETKIRVYPDDSVWAFKKIGVKQ